MRIWIKRNLKHLAAWVVVLILVILGYAAMLRMVRIPVRNALSPLVNHFEDPRRVKYLIVHHSLSDWGDGAAVMRWHMDPPPTGNGWSRPGYHAVIVNGYTTAQAWHSKAYNPAADGRVDRLWPENHWVSGVRFGNDNALQVCLIGNLDKRDPSDKQMAALIELLAAWCREHNLDPRRAIFGHGEMQQKIGRENYRKTCPGRRMNMPGLRRAVYEHIQNPPSAPRPQGASTPGP